MECAKPLPGNQAKYRGAAILRTLGGDVSDGDRTNPIDRARAFLAAGRPGMAWDACRAEVESRGGQDATIAHFAAQVLLAMGRLDEAERWLATVSSLDPGRGEEPAVVRTRRGLEAARLTRRAEALQRDGEMTRAEADLRRAAELVPDRPWPINNLAHLCMTLGRLDEAIALFRAAAYHPFRRLRTAHSNLLLAMMHGDRASPAEQFAEHVAWAEQWSHRPSALFPPPVIHDPDPERPIRVGYVSPDFRDHPVAMFIRPVLEHHDRDRFEVTCYSDVVSEDDVTRQIRAIGHRWVDISSMSIETLGPRIREDRIDILIDLAVHSGANRQPLFAARPAPIQMTWLGYAGTTGSPAVDYRITDAVVDPPGMTEQYFTERLLRLPEVFWCFEPPTDAPQVMELDPSPDRPIRIGTATRLAKVTRTTVDLWSKLMHRVPRAKLCVAADPFADPASVEEWSQEFESRGVDRRRLELLPAMPRHEYLQFLSSLDVGLDTFPFNGGTTVCQTLWMGTPVVALAGATSVSRVTASILTGLGRREWVAETEEQWLAINGDLARDAAARQSARAEMRARMKSSALCDGARFTRDLESAWRQVFARACAQQQ
jgi:predicted O-linked N-acetylglucosamine transferase (SPINDLY family)